MNRAIPRIQDEHGFTLVELLVVITIVAVLISLLLPAFARARGQARQSACLSNQKQLGLAILQYVQDNDERFPSGIDGNPGGSVWSGEGWAGQCYPYVKAASILACPDDSAASSGPFDFAVSYGYNINLVTGGGLYWGVPPPGLQLSALPASSRTVLLFEVAGVTANIADSLEGTGPGGHRGEYLSASANGLDHRLYAHFDATTGADTVYATGALGGRPTAPDGQFQPGWGRHSDGSNYLLADGHALWMQGARVSSGLNAAREQDSQGATQAGFSAVGTAALSGKRFDVTFSSK